MCANRTDRIILSDSHTNDIEKIISIYREHPSIVKINSIVDQPTFSLPHILPTEVSREI